MALQFALLLLCMVLLVLAAVLLDDCNDPQREAEREDATAVLPKQHRTQVLRIGTRLPHRAGATGAKAGGAASAAPAGTGRRDPGVRLPGRG